MVVSHELRCVFIRLHRTASTSILSHLSKFDDSIITQIASSEDLNFVSEYPVDVNHVPAHIANHFVRDHLAEYYTFSFVRNPWDRIVSAYEYAVSNSNSIWSFNSFIETLERRTCWEYFWLPQSYYIGNVDFVGKFENLQNDFDLICDNLNIQRTTLKKKNNVIHKHYTEYYTKSNKEKIRKLYKIDIERFNYEFH